MQLRKLTLDSSPDGTADGIFTAVCKCGATHSGSQAYLKSVDTSLCKLCLKRFMEGCVGQQHAEARIVGVIGKSYLNLRFVLRCSDCGEIYYRSPNSLLTCGVCGASKLPTPRYEMAGDV